MKKILLSLCLLAGSVSAMDTNIAEVAKWCVEDPKGITVDSFEECLDQKQVDVKGFLDHPVPYSEGSTVKGDTWLHLFARAKNSDIVILLMNHGANWSVVNDLEETPVDIIAAFDERDDFRVALRSYIQAGLVRKKCFMSTES